MQQQRAGLKGRRVDAPPHTQIYIYINQSIYYTVSNQHSQQPANNTSKKKTTATATEKAFKEKMSTAVCFVRYQLIIYMIIN